MFFTNQPLSARSRETIWEARESSHCEERKRRSTLFFRQRLLRSVRNDNSRLLPR